MNKVFLVALTMISSLFFVSSCSKGGGPGDDDDDNGGPAINCDGVPKSFAADVNPIIQTFCNVPNCHAVSTVVFNGPGPLTNYQEVFDARARIRPQIIAGIMPQNTTLTTAQKNTIVCWIDAGAPNN